MLGLYLDDPDHFAPERAGLVRPFGLRHRSPVSVKLIPVSYFIILRRNLPKRFNHRQLVVRYV